VLCTFVGWGGIRDFYFGVGLNQLSLEALSVEVNASVAVVHFSL